MELGFIEEEKALVDIKNDFLLGAFTQKTCKCEKEMLLLGKIYDLLIYICPCTTAEIVKIKDYENMITETEPIDQVTLKISHISLNPKISNEINWDNGTDVQCIAFNDAKDIDWGDDQDFGGISTFGSKTPLEEQTLSKPKKKKKTYVPDAYQIYYEYVPTKHKPKVTKEQILQDNEWQEDYSTSHHDVFIKYQLFQIANPKCVVRYQNNGKALYFTEKVVPECCSVEMCFEFQFMAYCVDLILKDCNLRQFDEYDWGTVIGFYCGQCGEYKAVVQ
jgi:hypothetical protein